MMTIIQRVQATLANGLYALANALLNFARWCLWPRPRPAKARRVCIYRIGNLGDILCALPALHAVRLAYPEAKLTLLTSPGAPGMPGAHELLSGAPWLDHVWVYSSEEIATLRQQLRLVKRLRDSEFDVWIEFPSSLAPIRVLLRNMLVARFSGVRWGFGWRVSTIRWAARAQSARRVFPNEVERLLQIAAQCGITAREISFPLPLTERRAATVEALLHGWVPPGTPLAALAPGAKRPTNRWPLERYAEVGASLCARGFFVLLLGGAGDQASCEWIASRLPAATLNLAGRVSVLESCEALRRCAFVVCNDSGVQHMAAAVSTPCVSIFSGQDMPGKWHPYGAQHVVLRREVPCHPCYLDECPRDNLCLKLVQVSDVLRTTQLLRATSAATSL
ncbi:MAG TPA: glycosyltransferase family 9 protein [Terriglobia bacterium]|nr:glycosyltransferase family 9 protein [Terriglobia bacterium]